MEGTTELNEATFSSEGLVVNFSRTTDCKAKEGDGCARRRASRVLPAREGETAHRNVYPDEYPTGYVHEWRNLIECWQEN